MALKVLPSVPRTGDWGESQDTGFEFMVCPSNQLRTLLKSPDWFTSLRGPVLQTTFSLSDPEPSLTWLYPPSLSMAPRLLNSPRDPLGGPASKKVSLSCKGPETFLCSTYVPRPPLPYLPIQVQRLWGQVKSWAHMEPPSDPLSIISSVLESDSCVSLLPLLGCGSSKERSTCLCHSPEEFALLSLLLNFVEFFCWIALNKIILNFY